MAIYCIHCGTQLPDESRFCLNCGQPPRGTTPALPNRGTLSGYPSPVINTESAYGSSYASLPPEHENPGYPQPSEQGVPQYVQYPQHTQYPQSPQGTPFAPASPLPLVSPKKNRLPLYIVVAIVVVIAIVGSVNYVNFLNQSTPDKTLASFCSDFLSGNYADAFTLLTPNYQKTAGPETAWNSNLQYYSGPRSIASCTISNVNTGSSTATGTMTFNLSNGRRETYTVSLIDENDNWQIDNITGQS